MTDAEDRTFDVVSMLSHELRSPLVSMRGFARLLLDRWDRLSDDDRRELLTQIDLDAARLARLVDELLDVSRIESGRLTLRDEPVDLARLVAEVSQRVALAHPELRTTMASDPNVPTIRGDHDKLAQVVTNLLENAAKYATGAAVVAYLEVASAAPQTVELRFEDDGPGLAPGDHERIFDRFARAGGGRPSGLGLGLWISRAIAEAHGGSLTAASNPRGGTTFRLTLPVRSPTD